MFSIPGFQVRLVYAGTRTRYVLQVPEPDCPIPGWIAYSVLAEGLDGHRPVRLKLYERQDDETEPSRGPCAA